MSYVVRVLRVLIAIDAALGLLALPAFVFLVIGGALSGQPVAALILVLLCATTVLVYRRYWRRFPLRWSR